MKKNLILICALLLCVMCGCSNDEQDALRTDTVTPNPIEVEAETVIEAENPPNIDLPEDNVADLESSNIQLKSVLEYIMFMADFYSDCFIVEDCADENESIILSLQTIEETENECIEQVLSFASIAGMFTQQTFVENLMGSDAAQYSSIVILVNSEWSIVLFADDGLLGHYISVLTIDETFEQDNPAIAENIQELYYEKFKNSDLEMILGNK